MSTYVIGDVQGCLSHLHDLLTIIRFDPVQDELWFTGDLANRGPEPLATLRFIKGLGSRAICVLGNHDLTLLAALEDIIALPTHETAQAVLLADDRHELADWLRHLPLLHFDPKKNAIMTHAGIYPRWNQDETIQFAREAETALRGESYRELLQNMYGDDPSQWAPNLAGWNRMRFILNAFTRMRFVDLEGCLDFFAKGAAAHAPGLFPWYAYPRRILCSADIMFGHWAALEGRCDEPQIYALDEGCVWGGHLAAYCIETKQRFRVPCSPT